MFLWFTERDVAILEKLKKSGSSHSYSFVVLPGYFIAEKDKKRLVVKQEAISVQHRKDVTPTGLAYPMRKRYKLLYILVSNSAN